jgi:subtilisin
MVRFRKVMFLAAAALAAGWLPPAVGAATAAPPDVIVTLRPGAGDPDLFAAGAAAALRFPVHHVYHAAVAGFAAPLDASQRAVLAADPRVAGLMSDRRITAFGQVIPDGIRRIRDDLSPTAAIGAARHPAINVNVAVLDSGIDSQHPDLNVVGGADCTNGRSGYRDDYGHGTHAAGIIGAVNNTIGVVGVAPGVPLWGVRVLDANGDGTVANLLCGVDWVASTRRSGNANAVAVANLSLGGIGSDDGHCGAADGDVLHQAICKTVARGVTFVAAAGNDHVDASGTIPAAYREVITVSALADSDGRPGGVGGPPACRPSERDDTLASFSNFGPAVALIAPGVCILSTLPVDGRAWRDEGGYGRLSGTSSAAPHVAGAAALWLSRHPDATPAGVRVALVAAGSNDWDDRTDPDGIKEPLLDTSRF